MLIFLLSLAGFRRSRASGASIHLSQPYRNRHYALASLGVLYSVFRPLLLLEMANAMFMGQPEERGCR